MPHYLCHSKARLSFNELSDVGSPLLSTPDDAFVLKREQPPNYPACPSPSDQEGDGGAKELMVLLYLVNSGQKTLNEATPFPPDHPISLLVRSTAYRKCFVYTRGPRLERCHPWPT